jgi:predicted RNase H-like HicB family nuclease
MLSAYPACFYKEKTGGYSVIFPDLNHLATCGDTLEEAFAMAVDCLAGYLYSARQMGETVPSPSALDRIDPDAEYDEYEEVFINLVTVDVAEYAKRHFERSVKKTLTIPKWLNDKAELEQINFSQLLQAALRQKLGL